MEINWLQDFIALEKFHNFSEAAKSRHVTQPAFSRRIRLLETWLGVTLINRDTNPVQLTEAGQAFLPKAESIIEQITDCREQLQLLVQGKSSIDILTQHSLMVGFVPYLLEAMQPVLGESLMRFISNDQPDSVQQFLDNKSDFLLCFSSLGLPQRLNKNHIEKLCIGQDRLLPLTGVDAQGTPLHRVCNHKTLKVLSYPEDSFFRRLITEDCGDKVQTKVVFENALSAGLKVMAVKGYGMAWLPESLIAQELQTGQLQVIDSGLLKPIPLDINLYRHKASTATASQKFWDLCLKKAPNIQ